MRFLKDECFLSMQRSAAPVRLVLGGLVLLMARVLPLPLAAQDADEATGALLPANVAEAQVAERWDRLTDQQADEVTQRHLKTLMHAVHAYTEKNDNALPPPVVPNAALPVEKRLSGLVLLLPYLGVRPSYMPQEAADDEVKLAKTAQELYERIDLTKAWDDPANLAAAKTIVPVFLAPNGGPFRDERGFSVSHFAFVRGYGGQDDGAFPESGNVLIFDPQRKSDYIADGTVETAAMGQIHTQLGPWIAAGPATSRYLFHPSDSVQGATFGSRHGSACYFARGDGSLTFVDLAGSTRTGLRAFVTRAGQDGHRMPGNIKMYPTAEKWTELGRDRHR